MRHWYKAQQRRKRKISRAREIAKADLAKKRMTQKSAGEWGAIEELQRGETEKERRAALAEGGQGPCPRMDATRGWKRKLSGNRTTERERQRCTATLGYICKVTDARLRGETRNKKKNNIVFRPCRLFPFSFALIPRTCCTAACIRIYCTCGGLVEFPPFPLLDSRLQIVAAFPPDRGFHGFSFYFMSLSCTPS